MDWLIWTGAAISVAGLAGLIACIVIVVKAKRAGLSDEALRIRLQKVIPLNMGALLLSILGLMVVVAGILLS